MSEPEDPSADTPEPWKGDLGALRPAEDPLGAELDPDAAIERDAGGYQRPVRLPPPVIDTRKYQRMIGGFGLLLVVLFSIYLYAKGGNGTPGVPPGQRLHRFVAPLAVSDLASVDANAHPVCNPLKPSRRGLNQCDRKPIVLALFVLGYKQCVQQVDTLQAVSARFPKIQFAAVAVDGSKSGTAKLVRSHHWTIPVAYDKSNIVGQLYGVLVCPMIEIANGKGVVNQRLIGKHWLSVATLTRAVAKLPS